MPWFGLNDYIVRHGAMSEKNIVRVRADDDSRPAGVTSEGAVVDGGIATFAQVSAAARIRVKEA